MTPEARAAGSRGAARIASGADALAAAEKARVMLSEGASERDRLRRIPHAEVDALSAAGLLAVTVPAQLGGADVPASVLAQVIRLLAAGDPNVAQIPQSHFVYVNALRLQGTADQRALLLGEVLDGGRIANAQSEAGTKHILDIRTRIEASGGRLRLTGVKHYCTGALLAHRLSVLAKGDDDRLYVAYVPADAPGVQIRDDWEGMGQRTTASGSVVLDGVEVDPALVIPHHRTFEGLHVYGATAQLLHAAIDVGIAVDALEEAGRFVREHTRPWPEAGVDRAADDPLLVQRMGRLALAVRAAEALLREAGEAVDAAVADLTERTAGEASLAVAAAKVQAGDTAVEVTSALFEVAGTRSALESLNLDRHWRNARTHTLHDPPRWKVQHLGRHALDGTPPPRSSFL